MNEIISVKQLPIIAEQLQTLKADIEARVSEALAMECTDSTVKKVKEIRTELKKSFTELEQQRKRVKREILEPYERFEAIYKECVSVAFTSADTELKRKIDEVEDARKAEKRQKVKSYAEELKLSYGLLWLDTDRVIPNVTLSASLTSLMGKVAEATENIDNDIRCIDDPEILSEYQKCLNLAQAQMVVKERRKAVEQAKVAQEQVQTREQAEEKVNEIIAPPVVQTVEKTYKMSFTVVGTLSQLKEIKQFLESRGIKYE